MKRTLLSALLLLAVLAGPARAQSIPPGSTPQLGGPFMRLNLQAMDMAVEFPASFPGGDPDQWVASVYRPGTLPGPFNPGAPEKLIARGAGAGRPATFSLPVLDPEWRWVLVRVPDLQVYVDWTWTIGGVTYRARWLEFLSMFTNAGRSQGAFGDFGAPPGSVPIYAGPGSINSPPDAFEVALGHAVSDRFDASSFLAGNRPRGSLRLPWTVPWEGSSRLTVLVKFPNGRNPGFGIPVYEGTTRPPDKEGARVSVKVRLTSRGRRLARALGARAFAKKLGTRGIVDYHTRPIRAEEPERTWVPIGTCFHDHQRPKAFPCSQTCPPFPGMPKGYLLYTALDSAYGSETCTKGEALPPVPMY